MGTLTKVSILYFVVTILIIFHATFIMAGEQNMRERHSKIVKSTVRIEINGNPSGTGFAIDKNIIVTNYHVVQQFNKDDNGNIVATVAPNISVRFFDGSIKSAVPLGTTERAKLQKYISRDYMLLRVNDVDLTPLQLGKFMNATEGSNIYIAGYPLNVDQPIVARGILSTKWQAPGYLDLGGKRWVAWLDVTMNAGNSGGPVILMGDTPEKDVVIGIATFNLNPFAQSAREFAMFAEKTRKHGSVKMMGINIGNFVELVGKSIQANSLGVGGCVSIEYVAEDIK